MRVFLFLFFNFEKNARVFLYGYPLANIYLSNILNIKLFIAYERVRERERERARERKRERVNEYA